MFVADNVAVANVKSLSSANKPFDPANTTRVAVKSDASSALEVIL